jgi:tetratricopeptide (TPR) repeat protein
MKNKTKHKPAAPIAKQPAGPAAAALEISRDYAEVSKLAQKGELQEAWRKVNILYGKHPNDASVNYAVALILEQNKQRPDALKFAEKAVELQPGNAGYLYFLGNLYVELGLHEFAKPTFEKALAINQNMFQAHWALAQFFLDIGLGQRAVPHYEAALKSAPPESRPHIALSFAQCLRAIDRREEAIKHFQEAARNSDLSASALAQIAMLSRSDQNSEAGQEIARKLHDPAQDSAGKSKLWLALGRLRENGKDYDGAFAAFTESKGLASKRFDAADFEQVIADRMKSYTSEVVREFEGFGNPTRQPIFIVGMPRSGTTMTEQILSAHSQVTGVGELGRITRMDNHLSNRSSSGLVFAKMREIGKERWLKVPQQYLNLTQVLAPGAIHTVDKMPHNFLSVGFIRLCFPNARIIHCRRSPVDTFISAFQNEMNAFHSYSYDQEVYGRYYLKYLALTDHWQALFPDHMVTVQYEEMTAHPETEIRKLLDFLGLEFEEQCLRFNEQATTVRTFSAQQVRRAINTDSVARWRRYEKHLDPIRKILDEAGVTY